MKLRHLSFSRLVIKIASFIKKYATIILLLLCFATLGAMGIKGYHFLRDRNVSPVDLLGFFGSPVQSVDSTDGVTNFLLLGIRGEGSDSPNLSDTIIVFSYNHELKKIDMISVPRDLWVPSLRDRINTAFHYGEVASPGAGIKLAQSSIYENLGLPVHYTAVVNFSLFKQSIDLVGGIDVGVNPGFTDKEFPIPGRENALPISSRYETIIFPQGSNHLDGETALKFVRSRHADGGEGTDYARSRRQQQVISALRFKIVSPSFLLNKDSVSSLIDIISQNLTTNIPENLYPSLAKLALDSQGKSMGSIQLSTAPDDQGVAILYNPPLAKFDNKWVLMPKDDNWNMLKQYIQNYLKSTD